MVLFLGYGGHGTGSQGSMESAMAKAARIGQHLDEILSTRAGGGAPSRAPLEPVVVPTLPGRNKPQVRDNFHKLAKHLNSS